MGTPAHWPTPGELPLLPTALTLLLLALVLAHQPPTLPRLLLLAPHAPTANELRAESHAAAAHALPPPPAPPPPPAAAAAAHNAAAKSSSRTLPKDGRVL